MPVTPKALFIILLLAGSLLAVPTASVSIAAMIDGTKAGDSYPAAASVQTIGTQFGNNSDASADFADGSELDAAYGYIGGGNLTLLLTGNLQTNFNKLEVFFDVKPGGQNQLRGDNPDVDFNGLNRMGDDGSGNGLMFDNGFEADYWVTYTGGNNPVEQYLSASEILTGGGGAGGFVGGGAKSANNPITGLGPRLMGNLSATSDQSNILGVNSLGNAPDSPPESVLTGFELEISLAELGWDGSSPIKVTAFVNGGSHDFASNQWLGPLPDGYGNLGEPRNINLKDVPGDQFFTVVPEPSGIVLGVLAAMLVAAKRRYCASTKR